MCLRAHTLLKKKFKNILTIIAPRHIHRSKKIEKMSNNLKLNTQILNDQEMILDKKEVIILNSFGVMQNYFKYAKSVFVGKSTLKKLKNVGGQNPLEAAKLNCKIYHGSFVNNFREIYSILDNLGIAQIINDYNDLVINLINDLNTSNEKEIKNSKILDDLGYKIFTNTIRDMQNLITNEAR
jgi:3-deoxy-D-manno-octulosonic-acid transferase